jgi:hypothetical protein
MISMCGDEDGTNEQIAKRGGQVTLQPDTAVTHVVYDSGRSAQILARQLGLQTLSELPEGTVCVRYDWVVHCLRSVSSLVSQISGS